MRKLKIIFCSCFLIAAMSFTACGNYNSGTTLGQRDTSATLEQQDTSTISGQQDTSATLEQQDTSTTSEQQDTSTTSKQQDTGATSGQQDTNATSEQKQETSQYYNNKYASIADYVASDEVQKAVELLNNMEGLDIKLKADNNKMIYEYNYTTIAKLAGMEDTLKSVLESQKDIFINAANELKNEVNIDNPVVTVTYLDKNGDLIYSQDFPAN